MGKSIYIMEKPSVSMAFAKALGVNGKKDGYIENDKCIITWCIGHLVTLSYPEVYDPELKKWDEKTLPFLPEKYKYEVIKNVKKQFDIVKKLFQRKDIDRAYICPDPAREGAYIQDLVRMMAKYPSSLDMRMVWIDSQTDEEIKRGIKDAKPYSDYAAIIKSGYERAIEDYSVGINFSRIYSIKYGNFANKCAKTKSYRPISIGRVMTCVLGMIVNREKEIEKFVVTPFYKVNSIIGKVEAEWKAVKGSRMYESPLLYNENGFKIESDAGSFIKSLPDKIRIEKIEKKREKKFAPFLFNLAELQSECSKVFKISPAETLKIAQSLYEKKLTTYPRTDARVLSTAIAKEIDRNLKGIVAKYNGKCKEIANFILDKAMDKKIISTKYTDDSKVTDHYAIIPTGAGYESLTALSELEKNVYELITRRFLSIFLPPAEYDCIKITEDARGEKFYSQAKALVVNGYYEIAGVPKKDTETNIADYGSLSEGKIYPVSYTIKKGETTPPKRYTSGSIILAMENAGNLIEDEELRAQIKGSGIGTSATRAEIISKLIKLEYIKQDKNTQILSPMIMGNIVYEIVLSTVPELLNPKMTASWEKGLDGIVTGKVTPEEYRKKLCAYIIKEVMKVKESDIRALADKFKDYKVDPDTENVELKVACPICGGKLKTTEYGCICEKYNKSATDEDISTKKACRFGIGQLSGKTLSVNQLEELISSGSVGPIKGFKSKAGKSFDAIIKFNIDKDTWKPALTFEFPDNKEVSTDIKCPKCNKSFTKNKWNYVCDCGIKLPCNICGKDISDADIKQLIEHKKTDLIKGFTSKAGKKFNAYLVADEDWKVSFKFDK